MRLINKILLLFGYKIIKNYSKKIKGLDDNKLLEIYNKQKGKYNIEENVILQKSIVDKEIKINKKNKLNQLLVTAKSEKIINKKSNEYNPYFYTKIQYDTKQKAKEMKIVYDKLYEKNHVVYKGGDYYYLSTEKLTA